MARYHTYICCPHDERFEHDNYFGCVPKDFSPTTGRSKRFRQTKRGERFWWNGGCDAATTEGSET